MMDIGGDVAELMSHWQKHSLWIQNQHVSSMARWGLNNCYNWSSYDSWQTMHQQDLISIYQMRQVLNYNGLLVITSSAPYLSLSISRNIIAQKNELFSQFFIIDFSFSMNHVFKLGGKSLWSNLNHIFVQDYNGTIVDNNLSNIQKTETPLECLLQCKEMTGCAGWSWSGRSWPCRLMSEIQGFTFNNNSVSGKATCSPKGIKSLDYLYFYF